MKLLLTIIQKRDSQRLLAAWDNEGFHSVPLASAGGLLREGNVTLLLGLEAEKVDRALELVRQNCERQERIFPTLPSFTPYLDYAVSAPFTIVVGGATVFVLSLERVVYSLANASSV